VTVERDPRNVREQTDDSLKAERLRSDEELLVRSEALAEDAEALITKARERANLVLELARDREDAHLEHMAAAPNLLTVIEHERRTEDGALQTERATAESERIAERERRQLALLQLLALERESTDRTLETERSTTDQSLSAHVDMLAVVSHDLRNLLNVLVINAAAIVMSPDLATTVPLATAIQKAGGQMNILLEDLLDFSSMEAGKLVLKRASTDIVLLVRDAVAIHGPAAQANDIELELSCAFDALVIEADPRRLTRVLINLLSNAIKFTPVRGRIVVQIMRFDDGVEIAVSDSGPGIPETELDAIFERYRQANPARDRASGVGLGLFIARAIVSAHGGRIWAENTTGGGAVFRVRLPVVANARNL
jgi:signal transduction histidine kinase